MAPLCPRRPAWTRVRPWYLPWTQKRIHPYGPSSAFLRRKRTVHERSTVQGWWWDHTDAHRRRSGGSRRHFARKRAKRTVQTTMPAWHVSMRPSNATAAACDESWHAPTNDSSKLVSCTFARIHFVRFQRFHARHGTSCLDTRQFFHVHVEFMLGNVVNHLHVCDSRRSVVRQRPRHGRISASTPRRSLSLFPTASGASGIRLTTDHGHGARPPRARHALHFAASEGTWTHEGGEGKVEKAVNTWTKVERRKTDEQEGPKRKVKRERKHERRGVRKRVQRWLGTAKLTR